MSAVHMDVLSISGNLANGSSTLHPAMLYDDTYVFLIDAGLPGMAEPIADAMAELGVPLTRLTHIIITHSDMDHMGGLAQLLSMCPQKVEVLCHEKEKPFVQCDVPPVRLTQMEASLNTLTGERLVQMTALAQNLRANYKNLRADVTRTLADGEQLPCGAQVVYTPGHTPGHICLYLKCKTLISGDALNVTDGVLMSSPERLSLDMEATKASLVKLAGYDIETVVCYHGGEFSENVNQRMKELAGI